jgi:nucleoside-diphosphate-sugar epimerase
MLNQIDYYKGKTILITGAEGFIGSSVVGALSRVDCNLICLKHGSRSFDADTPTENNARIKIYKGDLRNAFVWEELLTGVDIIFHFAAQTSSRFANENPVEDTEINLLPVVRLIEICQKKGNRPAILFSGTVTQTGLTESHPVDESRSDTPITIYDINKLAEEKYLQYYSKEMGGESVTLRLANVYGPGPRRRLSDRGILNAMVVKALSGKPLTVYGKGNFVRDYIFIDDVVRAFLTAGTIMNAVNGKYYIVGSGNGYSIKEMAETVRDLVEKKSGHRVQINFIPIPKDLLKIERRHFVADTRRFRIDSGWEPRVSFIEGINRTVKYFMEN